MTTEQTENSRENFQPTFATRFLPWIIASGILVVYLFTLNHWVTLKSLPIVAKIARWDWHPGNLEWRPSTFAPLHFLVTYPFRWLSGSAQFLALNFFSALCAAMTLGLLARSVALLPHDRTREQRQRESGKFSLSIPHAWFPPLAAVLICGMQLTFWENAVVATGEMLDLLLFAYVIRCLLEFRISQRESWLTKFALVYGLGIANNWAMIGFFPFFLTALIWIKGISFFNLRFFSRLVLFGTMGLSLYLLFPLLASFSANSDQTFWLALKNHLRFQKNYLYNLPFKLATPLRGRLMVISLTSLLPLLMIGIRWPTFRGDVSAPGDTITAFMFRLVHLFFLGILLSIFFDLPFSPRELGYQIVPMLTFYYLSALAVGYFIGYALLVFGRQAAQAWSRSAGLIKAASTIILVAVIIAAIAVPVALVRKNLPLIRAGNSDVLNQYAKSISQSLPLNGAVILSDDLTRLYLLQAAYAQTGKTSDNLFLETGSLPAPAYHRYLHKRDATWPETRATNEVSDVELIQRLITLNQTRPVFYLHPSFGYYFEHFYPLPHKLVYELKLYPTNGISAPPLAPTLISENQTFWDSFIKDSLPKLNRLAPKNSDVEFANSIYSRALNTWGVEMQKAKMLPEAGRYFSAALQLNPQNVVAEINQQFNASLSKGEIRPVQRDDELSKKLGQIRNWETALTLNGSFDEPNLLVDLGATFARGGNLRQSAQLFSRAIELSPKNFGARLGLAKTLIEMQNPDGALKLVRKLRDDPQTSLLNSFAELELLRVESLARLAKNDFPGAEQILLSSHQKFPKDENRIALLTKLYLDVGQYTNALKSAEMQLKLTPKNPSALFTKAVLNMQFGQFPQAITTLDQLLDLQPDNKNALLNRAICHLQIGKLDAAKHDYESLQNVLPKNTFQIYYGLAQVAEKQNDKSGAIKLYKLYLKYAPHGTAEFADIQKRVKNLEGGK